MKRARPRRRAPLQRSMRQAWKNIQARLRRVVRRQLLRVRRRRGQSRTGD